MTYAGYAEVKPLEAVVSTLPLWIVLVPMAGAVLCGLAGRLQEAARDRLAPAVAFVTFLMVLALYPLVQKGVVVLDLPRFIGLGLHFRVDFMGFVFAALASFIWFLSTLYSTRYMYHEGARTRYYLFLLFSLSGCLGVFLAADFLSLFLFFEAMTVMSYALVAHNHSEEAMAAGRNYLYMGIFGGLCLLGALMILSATAGSLQIAAGLEGIAALGNIRYLLAVLFFIGFGIKAGAVPLHIWLPKAHPVAPTPASALLSGIMIKTGAYGLIRVFSLLFTPTEVRSPLFKMTSELGYWMIWIGIMTMAVAAVLALSQTHAKRVLAYSSVSQMGYILMGLGAAAYLGYRGPMGFAGLSYHTINHAFFKAGMFLMAGAVYLRTHSLEYSKLGGLWRKFPVTAACFLVAGAAISGIPLFNGYASKTLLHHAIVKAYEYNSLPSLLLAEKIFTVTGGLTFCYILRLFSSIFLGRAKEDHDHGESHGHNAHGHGESHGIKSETWLERAIFGIFAACILLGGLFPARVIERVIVPMAGGFTYDDYYLSYLLKEQVYNQKDMGAVAVSLGIGAVVFIVLSGRGFRFPLPLWLSVEQKVYRPVLAGMMGAFARTGSIIESLETKLYRPLLAKTVTMFTGAGSVFERLETKLYRPLLARLLLLITFCGRLLEALPESSLVGSIRPAHGLAASARAVERKVVPWTGLYIRVLALTSVERIYNWVVCRVLKFKEYVRRAEWSAFVTMIKLDYDPRGDDFFRKLSLMNLDLCIMIVFVTLVVVFFSLRFLAPGRLMP